MCGTDEEEMMLKTDLPTLTSAACTLILGYRMTVLPKHRQALYNVE
jgi:hypothetical protein